MKARTISIPGVDPADAVALRRISMALHSWLERECGINGGCIERDETTGRPYWRSSNTMKRWPIRDMEAGAMRRLEKIMARHPDLSYYVQGDPRGCALYILRPGDVPEGKDPSCYYSRGIAVCK